jgi:hypothetical protein
MREQTHAAYGCRKVQFRTLEGPSYIYLDSNLSIKGTRIVLIYACLFCLLPPEVDVALSGLNPDTPDVSMRSCVKRRNMGLAQSPVVKSAGNGNQDMPPQSTTRLPFRVVHKYEVQTVFWQRIRKNVTQHIHGAGICVEMAIIFLPLNCGCAPSTYVAPHQLTPPRCLGRQYRILHRARYTPPKKETGSSAFMINPGPTATGFPAFLFPTTHSLLPQHQSRPG